MARKKRTDNRGRVLRTGESQNKDGRYCFKWTDGTGKRNTTYSVNLVELREKEKQIQRDMEDGINANSANMTLNQLFAIYMESKSNIRESTRIAYNIHWNANIKASLLSDMKISQIKQYHIKKWIAELKEKGQKNSSIKRYETLLSTVLQFAVKNDLIRKNPCADCGREIKVEPVNKRALTVNEQKALLDFAKNDNTYSVYYPIILFLLSTGLRISEAIGLTADRIDSKNNVIHIDRQLIYRTVEGSYAYRFAPTKSSSGKRDIPLTENTRKALIKQKELDLIFGRRAKEQKVDGEKGLIFITRNGTPINSRNFGKALDGLVKAYNRKEVINAESEHRDPILLPHISPHMLRHTFCTRCAEAGLDIKVLQMIMGHSDISITMNIYNHVDAARVQNEMKKLENVM
ncbi:tyrosine-type recombinase/integrase [Blautia massiliensis (ex Durand et al. 2017)]|uniref:tyrosine-type recombinase/integrase n=1 Tax=Blautia massiliensis (ex Durand et al. 2017) TaxID=1737424 RepID=UPI0022E9860E|nr:tyrosine-type recombinase/integrase [Blautia massiliensis (ex Durand et al. 2017)]